ncbi:YcjF family protein [Atopobacter phocae]|uniref:YcjF family protein n=1 Tax=Atopobacter phocae TaxID=136492 RepID=UPI00047144C1|nr:YcjF family protein [Atopobacter phocae]
MKRWFKKKKKAAQPITINHVSDQSTLDDSMSNQEVEVFFKEMLAQFPETSAAILDKTYDKTKNQAEEMISKSQRQFESIFDEFLVGVDAETRKKCHRTIHAAAVSAAIVGLSPIPFSDAALLVPIQLTMMARLHKIFGQSWSASLGKSLSKEIAVVSLGRSTVGNIMKFIPVVGTVSGAAINASVASMITETVGWVTVKMLNDGEDIFNQVLSFKGQYKMLLHALKTAQPKK